MAGGNVYCESALTWASVAVYDLAQYGYSLSADLTKMFSDNRKYAQAGCSSNHMAEITAKTYNMGTLVQSSSATPVVGKIESAGAVLVLSSIGGSDVTVTMSPARCTRISGSGSYGRPGELDFAVEAIGQDGTDPTITIALAA